MKAPYVHCYSLTIHILVKKPTTYLGGWFVYF
ncbi:hypothetical protein J2Z69_002436 [Paenibacillus shirakamiensis]|uniref:Uncharacterized protein n=1 Tax=Paenibacillus shirakamiensis TaxID=1265935 RepID=A0ABS4JI50_9BACL|nr:hypothetical protein [Paenibacillus shirakamiensis]